MRPLRLELSNFLSYREPTSIALEHVRAAAILGPNGAGKTSIVEALGWALYGKGRFRGPDAFVSAGQTECRVAFEFELAGSRYRVERQRHVGASSKSELVLLVDTNDHDGFGWQPAGGATIAETQAAIEQLIGMDHATWEATSYIAQGRADTFTALTPAGRKELLADVLDLSRYETLHERARERGRDVAISRGAAATSLAHIEASLAETGDVHDDLAVAELDRGAAESRVGVFELDHQAAERHLEQARERARGLEALRGRIEELRARRATETERLARERARAEQLLADHQEARQAQEKILANLRLSEQIRAEIEAEAMRAAPSLEQAERTLARQRQLVAEASTAAELAAQRLAQHASEFETARGRIDALSLSHDASCYACGQDLPDPVRDRLLADLHAAEERARAEHRRTSEDAKAATARAGEQERHARGLEAQIEQARAELVQLEQRISVARADEQRIPMEEEQLDRMRAHTEELEGDVAGITHDLEQAEDEFDGEIASAQNELASHAETAKEVASAEARLQDSRIQLQAARTDLDRSGQRLGGLREKAEAARGLERRREQVTAELRELTATESGWAAVTEMFGRNGIPALVIENAVPALEASANRWLERLASGRLHVSIESLRANKSGDLRETLDITVADGEAERPLEGFSGGERQRVNLALRLALAELLAERAGRQIETLILDEAFTALDTEGRQLALEVIRALEDTFPLVLFVTHLDLGQAFPTQIEVTRNGTSRVEVVSA